MSSLLYISSPVRSPRPRPVDVGASPVPGSARQSCSLRYRNAVLPPANPKRLHFSSGPSPIPSENGARDVISTAASYTSREGSPTEAQARREDEEHGATQLILLLTLSVVLLTLPWVVDHPVTLLVPVALFVLPITSGALRSMVVEGVALIAGGIRWFWRHRKSGRTHSTKQSAASVIPPRTPYQHPAALPAQPPLSPPQRTWQASGLPAFPAPKHSEIWQTQAQPLASYPASLSGLDQRGRHAGMQAGNAHGSCAHSGSIARTLEWQVAAPRPHPVLQVAVHHHDTAGPELTTPDLDFDSEGEASTHEDTTGGYVAYERYAAGPDRCSSEPMQVQVLQQQSDAQSWMRVVDQPECTVYNWDVANECTQRRGHRSRSDLLNNVQ